MYDKLNRRTRTYNRLGDYKSFVYDLNSNLIEETDFEGRTTNHGYDKLNRLTRTIQPALPGLARGDLVYTYYNEADPKTNLKTEQDQEGYVTAYEYNARYQRTKRTNAQHGIDGAKGIHLWEYDAAGNLEKETDEEERAVRHEYDGQNRLTADIRTLDGRDIRTDYDYDPAGNRTKVIDPRKHTTEFKYDEWNRLWKVISPADPVQYETATELDGEGNKIRTIDANVSNPGIRTWKCDPRGLVVTYRDGETTETAYEYDANGNNTRIVYDSGHPVDSSETKIAYDAEDRKGLVTEALGQPEERTSGVILYDKVGNPLQVKDGNGNVHTTEYNALNLPWKSYDPAPFDSQYTETNYYKTGKVRTAKNRRGFTTTTGYDQLWRVTLITDPLSQTITTTYDNVGNVRTVTDKRRKLSETIYDDLYRPKEKKRAGLTLFSYEYDDAGNLTAETDAEHKRTAHHYSPRNLRDLTTYADTNSRSFTYDGNGNLATETDEELKVTTHGYDRENRLTSTEFAGETTSKSYTPRGDLLSVTLPEGHGRSYEYDGLRRLVKVIDDPTGFSLVSRYEYDKNNNRTKTFDARNYETEQTYDQLNRLTANIRKKSSGDLITSFDLYDPEGSLIDLTDPKGQKQHHSYDELNRRTQSDYRDTAGAVLTVTTGYDENNNIITSSTPADSTANIYDDFDRLQSSTQRGTTISYDYYKNGNRKTVSTPTNSTTYSYDDRNRVKTASAGSAITSFDYYPDGKKKSVSYPNGAAEEYDYHSTNRVKTITHKLGGSLISRFEYPLYDHNGNRISQTETRGTRSIITGYHYDTLDRMDSYRRTENGISTETAYTFDGYNRASETVTNPDGATTSKIYSYDETDWLTLIDDGTKQITYGYDNNGNTSRKTDSSDPGNYLTYDYDARDKLTRTTKGTTTLGSYAYNAHGYRIRQLGSDRGDVNYYYDGTAVIEERSGSGLLAHYRYANKLYSLTSGTGSQYYHHDALGSTSDLTDDTGNTQTSYFLNPWGLILETLGDSVNRRVFTGKEIDQNTGLVYFGARYYDPDTARFTTQDSYVGEQTIPPSLHRYLYAYSNPTVFVDLEGYAAEDANKFALLPRFDKFKYTDNVLLNIAKIPFNAASNVTNTVIDVANLPLYNAQYALKNGAEKYVNDAIDVNVRNAKKLVKDTKQTVSNIADYHKNTDLTQKLKDAGDVLVGGLLSAHAWEGATTSSIEMLLIGNSSTMAKNAASITKESVKGMKEFGRNSLQNVSAGYNNSPLANEIGAVGDIENLKGKVGGADFYGTSSGQIIPGRFNRYWGRNPSTLAEAKSGELAGRPDGTYVSFDVIDDAIVGGDKLQVPNGRIGRTGKLEYRVSGDSLDVIDRLVVPNGKWNTSSYPEPLTADFKEFGPGKSTQAIITGEKPIPVDPSTLTKTR